MTTWCRVSRPRLIRGKAAGNSLTYFWYNRNNNISPIQVFSNCLYLLFLANNPTYWRFTFENMEDYIWNYGFYTYWRFTGFPILYFLGEKEGDAGGWQLRHENYCNYIISIWWIGTMQVHRLMCLELKTLINKISHIHSDIESARPGCTSGIHVLCSFHVAVDKSKLLIQYCSESSKLYLVCIIVVRMISIKDFFFFFCENICLVIPSLVEAHISKD